MIGTDIVAIKRFAKVHKKFPQELARKVLHPSEFSAYLSTYDQTRFLAKRWAAKEAIAKAIGTGLRTPLVMPAICINKNNLGAPFVTFDSSVTPLLVQRNIKSVALSLSDEQAYVVAFALCLFDSLP